MATYKDRGRKILAEKKKKKEVGKVGGKDPKAGLWIVNKERRRVAGRIVYIAKRGVIVTKNVFGALVEHSSESLDSNGYVLLTDKDVRKGTWTFLPDPHPTTYDHDRWVDQNSMNDCLCGCGRPVGATFAPGHDSKLKSRYGKDPKSVNEEQLAYIRENWGHLFAV